MSTLLPYLFLLLILLFPSSHLQQFNGLPLSRWAEFLALAFLLPFLFSAALRQKAAGVFGRLRIPAAGFYALGGAALLLKIGLLVLSAREGFAGCYSSPAAWAAGYAGRAPKGGCERSYEDLFGRSGATRIDSAISFTPDSWNLMFLNSLRYDFPDSTPGGIPRSRIPLNVRWSGTIAPEKAQRLLIHYIGSGTLAVGTLTVALPPSYQQVGEVAVELPAGKQDMTLEYSFDDGSRTGEAADSLGPGPQLQVDVAAGSGEQPLHVAQPGWAETAAVAGGDLLFFLLLLVPLTAFFLEAGKDKWSLLILGGFLVICYFLPLSQRVRGLGMTAGLVGFWLWHCLVRSVRPVAVYSILVAVSLANNLLLLPDPSRVVLRSAQDDPLTYESEAYSVLSTGSLECGESVYLYQPMFRYIKFGEHALFGDGMTFSCAFQLAFFFGGAFFLGDAVLRKQLSRTRRVLLAAIGSLLFFLGGYYVAIVIRNGLSEYMTWSLLLWALPMIYLEKTKVGCLLGIAALGFSFAVRTDQLPAILWLVLGALYILWRKNKPAFGFGVAMLAIFLLLPLAHNIYFGHRFVLATTSNNLAINLPLPPSTWAAFFRGDASAMAGVKNQMQELFLIPNVSLSTRLILAGMAGLAIFWLAAGIYAVFRRRFLFGLLWIVPILYLAPHVFFAVFIYYPRLIFIGYLAMGAVTGVWLARGWSEPEEHPAPLPAGSG